METVDSNKKHYLFLDESGDHSLDKIDPQYPLFVLGGVLIDAEKYDSIDARWKGMKQELFGTDEIARSTVHIRHPQCKLSCSW